jgi:hypothetical protein
MKKGLWVYLTPWRKVTLNSRCFEEDIIYRKGFKAYLKKIIAEKCPDLLNKA